MNKQREGKKSALQRFKLYYEEVEFKVPEHTTKPSRVANDIRYRLGVFLRHIFQFGKDFYKHTFSGVLNDTKNMHRMPRRNKTNANNNKR